MMKPIPNASRLRHLVLVPACALALLAMPALAETMAALVHKAKVEVHAAPDVGSPSVATLERNAELQVAGQQGLWFKVTTADGKEGFVRVNDVRMAYAGKEGGEANVRALFTGQAGKGRATETAGVRGLDESNLKSADLDRGQLAKLEANRATPEDAEAAARSHQWVAMEVAYPGELPRQEERKGGATQKAKRAGLGFARSLLSAAGHGSALGDSALDVADKALGKSEEEIAAEEAALAPEIAGRVLGAVPLWDDRAAQQRVNLIGRWMASHTTRPELPWTFGVIDSPEINAFAAPGGYVLVTRGMYELLADDAEVAA